MFRSRSAFVIGSALSIGAAAALAQPEIISLGTGGPNSVTPSLSGVHTVGGAGLGAPNAGRWTLNGAVLTPSSIAGTAAGAGYISADGAYAAVLIPNTGPQIFGNTATGVAPPFSMTPTLVPSTTLPAATELRAARWNASNNTFQDLGGLPIVPSLMVYGSGSSGGTTGSFVAPHAISSDGRFIVGQGYVSSYNNSGGTTISDNTFHWRAWIWDAQANGGNGGFTIMPTPFRTSNNTWRRRTGNAYAVSTDGTVVVGAQEHNVSTLATADPDGGRLVVWRYNSGTSQYEMSYLPNGVNGSGFPHTYATTPRSVHMNPAGTIIVGVAVDNAGTTLYLAKWLWNAGTSSWDPPINLGAFPGPTVAIASIVSSTITTAVPHGLAVNDWVYIAGNSVPANNGWKQVLTVDSPTTFNVGPMADSTGGTCSKGASWLPFSVRSCPIPPSLRPTGMSDDGNTIVGVATYSVCGSFMSGGFIWTAGSGVVTDWYDYLNSQEVAGIDTYYGPIGDPAEPGNPLLGLPRAGSPLSISADGNAVVGAVTGTQIIAGAPPWIVVMSGGPGCVAPVQMTNPTTPTNFSACSNSIILNTAAAGTLPIAYQWYKDSVALVDGLTASGSTIVGATSFQLRVNPTLTPADVGIYHSVATGGCGSPVNSTSATVQLDPAFPPAANDVCDDAIAVTAGTNVLAPAQSPCSAYINDPMSGASCATGATKTDRWFVFTPTTAGSYRIETCGANYDTIVSVFSSCGGSELGCNDNYLTGPATGCNSARSRVAIAMAADTPYYIRIAAPVAAFISGTSTLNLSIIATPAAAPNDECNTAAPAGLGVNLLDTTEATNDWTVSCNATLARDVWFVFSPVNSGRARFTTCPGTTWNTVLSVHDGCFGAELACNDNAGVSGCTNQSIIENYMVESGSTHYIRVGGNSTTAFGAGQLNVTLHRIGDTNCDGTINFFDIDPFLVALFDAPTYPTAYPTCYLMSADINESTTVDFFDIDPFLNCLFSAICP